MKNVIILGSPRSGKSTFAKMILKEFSNYNIIQEDVIVHAYIKSFFELCEENDEYDYISTRDITNISHNSLQIIFDYSIYSNPSLNFIFDGMNIPLEELAKYNKEDTIVLVFGYPKITIEEGLHNIRKYDTKNDWTYIEPDYRIRMLFNNCIRESKEQQEKCRELGIKFVDTSKNREQVLKDLFEWIKQEL